jgi:hypothetical protein
MLPPFRLSIAFAKGEMFCPMKDVCIQETCKGWCYIGGLLWKRSRNGELIIKYEVIGRNSQIKHIL